MYRQGDVLLVPVSGREMVQRGTRGNRKVMQKDVVLAEGEATGHNHVLLGEVDTRVRRNQVWMVAVAEPTQLVHQEHDPVAIPAGYYEVVRQEEYTPRGSRMVFD